MNRERLYKLLGIPGEAEEKLNRYEKERSLSLSPEEIGRLLERRYWDEEIRNLKERLGEDPDGIGLLWEELEIVRNVSLQAYEKREIPMEIFTDTMRFTSRFLEEEKRKCGEYRFTFGWWFPRQMSLSEFRIGALEYELIREKDKREIAIHIPSDADLSPESVEDSITAFLRFEATYFPDWIGVSMTCLSWMMMPQLSQLLGDTSNVVRFMQRFEIEEIFEKETWYRDWIYPGFEGKDEDLPEKTTLQKRLKARLLEGKTFGVALGRLKLRKEDFKEENDR